MATTKKATKKVSKPEVEDKPARVKSSKVKATGTEMVAWDEELAKYAAESVASEANAGSGLKSFSLKAGVLAFDDAPMAGNQMAVVVLDHVLENTYYEDAYDPDNPTPPTAYALGRDEKTITWSEDSDPRWAGELCIDSDINQFGSADKGRGKAARNLRRLLVIPAGTINKKTGEFELIEDEEHFDEAAPAFLKIPPTSTTNWSMYVKQLNGALRKPPFAVVTLVKVVPDAKTQFKVTFEALEELPMELMETLVRRHKEAAELIMQPYNMERDEAPERPARRGAAAKKAPAKKAAAKSKRKY